MEEHEYRVKIKSRRKQRRGNVKKDKTRSKLRNRKQLEEGPVDKGRNKKWWLTNDEE